MKRIYLFLVALITTACTVSAGNAGARELRIMSYNLRAGTMATMDSIAAAINACRPDFVALQEVDCNTYRPNAKSTGNNGINFINELAQRTGMFGYFGTTIPLPPTPAVRDSLETVVAAGRDTNALPAMGNYYGIALLSRYPAMELRRIPLPNPLDAEPRIMLTGTFLTDGNDSIGFACTHLDYTDPTTITLQANTVADIIEANGIPSMVAGDFNTEPGSEAYNILRDRGIVLSGSSPTFPSDKPTQRLDHIFGFPAHSFRLVSTTEGKDTILSDHIYVLSVVSFDGQPLE